MFPIWWYNVDWATPAAAGPMQPMILALMELADAAIMSYVRIHIGSRGNNTGPLARVRAQTTIAKLSYYTTYFYITTILLIIFIMN